jgi:Asp-tRNA(Asn)/Glu-tRNA(Gln) amidotransferase A subunit family amidase
LIFYRNLIKKWNKNRAKKVSLESIVLGKYIHELKNPSKLPVKSFQELYDSGQYTSYAKESYDREIKINPDTLNEHIGYQRGLVARTSLQDWTLQTMAENGLSAIAYPSSAQLADLIGKEQAGLFTRWSEGTGFPAISVPMGYAKSNTGTSPPANIEFLGRAFDESGIIHIASAYENFTHKRVEPPLPMINDADFDAVKGKGKDKDK